MTTEIDPVLAEALASLVDEDASGPTELRIKLLSAARRPFVPIRHTFVQQPRSAETRAAKLSELVRARNRRALDTTLLVYALEPILGGTPLPNSTWARLLSGEKGPAVPVTAVSKTWGLLEDDYRLVERGRRLHKLADVRPLREDGSGEPYIRPGRVAKGTTGYFILPHTYWSDGWDQTLTLPAKAMLLVYLSATQKTPTLCMSYEQADAWYGLSERTAERGIRELRNASLLGEHGQKVAEARSATGSTIRYHRFLLGEFSTHSRQALQQKTSAETRGRLGRAARQEST
ncbi:MAG TPA: hypothetical protein VEO01_09625 [Pseudonocardiaceae bacterium]|nr:hypothetical protein [Pseudonocardiaceae bacterium]